MSSVVAVVVLNYNSENQTIECLESLSRQTYKKITPIVVDNSPSVMKNLTAYTSKRNIVYIRNDKNKGFAGGVNTGINYALDNQFEYIVLLNNDAVPDKKWIHELMLAASQTQSDIVTGLMLHSDGKTVDSTGEQYSTWGLPFPRDRNAHADSAPESSSVFGATGGGTLYRSSVFDTIGTFDETFFAYYEDVDISFRAQLAGLKVYYSKSAILYHEQGGTFNKYPKLRTAQHFKNLPLLYIKNVPSSLLLPVGVRLFVAYNLMFIKATVNGALLPALKGWLLQIPLFWFHALPARRHIQQNRKVSNIDIKHLLWPDLPPDQTGLRKFRSLFTGKK